MLCGAPERECVNTGALALRRHHDPEPSGTTVTTTHICAVHLYRAVLDAWALPDTARVEVEPVTTERHW